MQPVSKIHQDNFVLQGFDLILQSLRDHAVQVMVWSK